MKYFVENVCRICSKVFCCRQCRETHEENYHKINPECDICLYGRVYLRDPSVALLEHIEEKHWPLHCVSCDRLFDTIEEIFLHKKCPKPTVSAVPASKVDTHCNSPPVISYFPTSKPGQVSSGPLSSVTTSTPVARDDEKDGLQISEVITPVDCLEKKGVPNYIYQYKSTLTPIFHDNRKDEQYSKRRVTFSENVQEIENEKADHPDISGNDKCDIEITSEKIKNDPDILDTTQTVYYSTQQDQTADISTLEQIENNKNEAALVLSISKCDTTINETLWESAITDRCEVCLGHIPSNDDENTNINENISEACPAANSLNEIGSSSIACSDCTGNFSERKVGIWSSMASMFRNMVDGFSSSSASQTDDENKRVNIQSTAKKRSKAETDYVQGESPLLKKMKLTDIKCRRPIRNIRPLLHLKYAKKRIVYAHKRTQTD